MNIDLAFYWKLFWRRLPVMMLFVLVCSTLGVITALKLPETWSTSARLLVEAPQIPSTMVTGTVQIDPVEQLDIIQQKLLTRVNLLNIANRFDVYANIREMEPDTVVEQMRRDTRVRRTDGRNEATVLTISFEARSGAIARDVVSEYVTLVLQENSQTRVDRAENTLAFFRQEVERLGEELDRQSAQIAIFKSENANSLPEDQSYRLSQQTLLQERLARLERELMASRKQREEVVRIYEMTGRAGETSRPPTREEEQLRTAQAELDQAKLVYSETHPRLVQLKARVKQLESTIGAGGAVGADADESGGEPGTSSQDAMLQASLAEIDGRMEFLEADIASTQSQLERLQTAISASSANGIELDALERDYVNIQARYNAAVNNLNSAQMSERIESTAQGQRILVIESASLPQVPAGPNRPKIAAMGIVAGLALAVGYFMLLEMLNRSVRRPSELISRFNIQPIAVVPYMESRREKFLRRAGILTATAVVIVVVPLSLWYIDANYLPLELVVQKGLDRLGLG